MTVAAVDAGPHQVSMSAEVAAHRTGYYERIGFAKSHKTGIEASLTRPQDRVAG